MARDGERTLPQARTALFEHGCRAELAVVLLHGLTNNPAQFAQFAPLLFERGVNVFVPRMPMHGDRDRLSKRIGALTAEALLAAADEAVDIAGGLGERVAVLGISMGALLAAHFAQFHAIARAVVVAPDFALLNLPYAISRVVERIGLLLPNAFLWWDPRVRSSEPPITAYPWFSTHALMRSLRIGDRVYAAARQEAPNAQRIVTIVNRGDPAVNNAVTKRVSDWWAYWKPGSVAFVELTGLPRVHDVIDPLQPFARPDIVYPELFRALGVRT
ncbi:MAG TPA: alpha/beta fold hydrolase [Candidatus Nitrosotalea sp.]|nr:alpha/beta fold hydrolase [Candidatus Nitrosotalea sp.]